MIYFSKKAEKDKQSANKAKKTLPKSKEFLKDSPL